MTVSTWVTLGKDASLITFKRTPTMSRPDKKKTARPISNKELFEIDFSGKVVVVIGRPASGKTHIAGLLAKNTPGSKLWHTDDFISYGGVEGLYQMIVEMEAVGLHSPAIIEGVGGYRLLRKGAELGIFFPDVVVELVVSDAQVERVYNTERESGKLKKMAGFVKGLNTVLEGYKQIAHVREMEGFEMPEWITVQNDF